MPIATAWLITITLRPASRYRPTVQLLGALMDQQIYVGVASSGRRGWLLDQYRASPIVKRGMLNLGEAPLGHQPVRHWSACALQWSAQRCVLPWEPFTGRRARVCRIRFPCRLTDNIWAVAIVWKRKKNIIRTALCRIVICICARSYAHIHMIRVKPRPQPQIYFWVVFSSSSPPFPPFLFFPFSHSLFSPFTEKRGPSNGVWESAVNACLQNCICQIFTGGDFDWLWLTERL